MNNTGTNVNAMANAAELSLEQLEAVSGGVKKMSDSSRENISKNLDEFGNTIVHVAENPGIILTIIKSWF